MLLVGSLANSNDMSLSPPNTYQSNWDLSAKYQQDELIFQDLPKDDGNNINKYNVDGYESRQHDTDSFVDENYGSGKYFGKDLTYLVENVNNKELPPSIRPFNGKFSNVNIYIILSF